MDFATLGPQLAADPYPFYKLLAAQGPIVHAEAAFGIGARLVTGHAAVSTALRSKLFGKEAEKVLPPEVLARIPGEAPELAVARKSNMLFRDPPVHTRLRGLVNLAFTPRTVERLRPHVAEIADHLLDAAGDRFDLIRAFAFPLPIIVIAELLGVPAADRDQFKAWSTDMTRGLNPAATADDVAAVAGAIAAVDEYMTRIIEARRREARADLISDLVRVQESGDQLSMEELLATCRLLLTAGHETTVNLIGNGVLALLNHRDQWDALRADPSLLPNAVEELLRFDSPVQLTLRFAFGDGELAGQSIRRGDLVVLLIGAANRDPAVFADPDRLDVRRANANAHVSFGAGIHYCLGAPLARLEGEIAVAALQRRFPKLALAVDQLTWRTNPVLRGLQELPVVG